MPNSYVEVEIRTDPSLLEELAGVLSQLGFEGFWEDGSVLRCYMRSVRWEARMEAEVKSLAQLLVHPSVHRLPQISIRIIEEENWNAKWESTIRPIHATERIVITPTWQTYRPAAGQILLIIDPKMSFGTGYHESTRLALKLLERSTRSGMHVLDVGTGSGVLAIAAVKLGASSATGVDIDEWSYNNARENTRLNSVERQVSIRFGDISAAPAGPFDIIAANLQRSTIEASLPAMLARLGPHGTMLLSGLLTVDAEPMIECLRTARLAVTGELGENEWIALSVARA